MIDQTENIGSCDIHYIEAGDTAGRDIILLHGMKFKAQTWQELGTLQKLADAGKHALALDLPGFGQSPQSDCAADQVLNDFIRYKNLDKPVIVGPSMGGRVALEFCLTHADLVGALVLVGAVGVQENRDRLSEISMPTLIVWGGEDVISPIENGRLLEQLIEGSSFFVIDGAPHPCYLEQPDMWHRELLTFLDNL